MTQPACRQIAEDIRRFAADSYPSMLIRVEPYAEDPARTAIYFTEPKFSSLYPAQRYHCLIGLIPFDY